MMAMDTVCVLQESDCCVSLAIFMVCLWVCGHGLLGVKAPSFWGVQVPICGLISVIHYFIY